MKILKEVSFNDLPFEHEFQSGTARLVKAINNLNGKVLPIETTDDENADGVRSLAFIASKKAGIPISTRIHEGTVYIWRRRSFEAAATTV